MPPPPSDDHWIPRVTLGKQMYPLNGSQAVQIPHQLDDTYSDTELAWMIPKSSSYGSSREPFAFDISPPESSGSTSGYVSQSSLEISHVSAKSHFPSIEINADIGDKRDGGSSGGRKSRVRALPRVGSYSSPSERGGTSSAVRRKRLPSIPRGTSNTLVLNLAPNDSQSSDSSSQYSRDQSDGTGESVRLSYYDWDAQIPSAGRSSSSTTYESTGVSGRSRNSIQDEINEIEPLSAERLAQLLQTSLSPPPPESIDDLFVVTRDAIDSLVEGAQLNAFGRMEDDKTNEKLIRNVVVAVRNLLCVCGVPFESTSLDSASGNTARPRVSLPHPPRRTTRDAQYKVTIALSKLILSALQDDTIERDSVELRRVVAVFVRELQRESALVKKLVVDPGGKRVHGVFSTANIGLGVAGAGRAGNWTGFGWIVPEDCKEPGTIFRDGVMTDIRSYHSQLEERLDALAAVLGSATNSVEIVAREGQAVVTQFSTFLAFVGDIHMAEHVDLVDKRRHVQSPPAEDQYVQSVNRARALVRTLEETTQSLYDDGAALLLSTQAVQRPDSDGTPSERRADYHAINVQVTSLIYGLAALQRILDALLSIGHEQNLIQEEFNGRLEWRMSLSNADDENPEMQYPVLPNPQEAEILDEQSVQQGQRNIIIRQSLYMVPLYTKLLQTSDMALSRSSSDDTEDPSATPSSPVSPELIFSPPPSIEPPSPSIARVDKRRRILGDEAPLIASSTDDLDGDQKPWYLRSNYSQSEIIIDPDGSVRAGTMRALVKRLTAHEHGDATYRKIFLTTYKSFTSLDELFELLVQRFRIQPPEGLDPKELKQWRDLKQRVIQIRVMNVFMTMVQEEFLDREDAYILDRMKEFAINEGDGTCPATQQLLALIERTKLHGNVKTMINTSQQAAPPPIIPKATRIVDVLDIDPLELARQLTILESQLYQKIRPLDCLHRTREQAVGNHMDSIGLFVQTFDRIANWVTASILFQEDFRRRAVLIKHFVSTAERCREMHNYSSMIAIVSGLTSTPIRRLKRSWEFVPLRYTSQLSACEVITDPRKNFSNYSATLANATPPCVPFIGVFLRALLFIHNGNKDRLSENLINFDKRQKTADVIHGIKRWQSMSFNFSPIPSVLAYIEESLGQYQGRSEASIADHFWNLSLEREPKEGQDDKQAARIFRDSGFLFR